MKRQKILYGNGEVNLVGDDAKGIEINFIGKAKVDDKTPANCIILLVKDRIIIFTKDGSSIPSKLFTYDGHLQITDIKVFGNKAKRLPSQLIKVMDFTKFLAIKPEELELRPELIGAGYKKGLIMTNNSIIQTEINNLDTYDYPNSKFVIAGTEKQYEGYFHIHKESGKVMTGKKHTEKSILLTTNSLIKRK